MTSLPVWRRLLCALGLHRRGNVLSSYDVRRGIRTRRCDACGTPVIHRGR